MGRRNLEICNSYMTNQPITTEFLLRIIGELHVQTRLLQEKLAKTGTPEIDSKVEEALIPDAIKS
jgi:hypothetical protein